MPRWVRFVPNALSLFRLMLAIGFAWLPSSWRLGAVIAAGLSDWADGVIARRCKVMSWQGGLLDAVADKAFTLAVLLTLVMDGAFAWWAMLVLLSRDFAVGFIAGYAGATRRWAAFKRMPSRWAGKLTTAMLFVLFVVWLVGPTAAQMPVLVTTMALSVAAGVDYLTCFVMALRAVTPAGEWGANDKEETGA